ncbi:hypothetical protein GE061_009970 [Apolygus lucorum]|uniref:Inactive dipeptidyl peptidase 10 n=1 Tax=Apolygus lucorum TaxID=248454 RepID=A0A8S9Y3S4_APOLU|nr:hypothetical protein GE061_009970 [Apolygus lucorum]
MSIILSLLVISGVISGIVTAIYTLGYVDELLYWSGKRMSLQEALRGELTPWRVAPSWVTSDHFMFHADDGGLSVYTVSTDTVNKLVSNHTMTQLNIKWSRASADLKYVLLRHNIKRVFKNTFLAHHTIYDVKNDHHIPIRLRGVPKVHQSKLRAARWCGNTNTIIVVAEDNNIYLLPSPTEQSTDIRLTDSGQDGLVYHGIPDWLYQEDIVEGEEKESFWCSLDGSMLLYASYNDTDVRNFRYPTLDTPNTGQEFPHSSSIPYPTPGTFNPVVELWLTNLSDPAAPPILLKPPQVVQDKFSMTTWWLGSLSRRPGVHDSNFESQEYYLTSAGWVNGGNDAVAAVWMNRPQNLSVISICKAPEWSCIESHAERAVENGWVSIKGHPVFSADGQSFLLLSRIQEGDTGRYTHIKHVTLGEENRISVISHGKYHVTDILAWDYVNNIVYYLGSDSEKAGQRHLYVVKNTKSSWEPLSRANPKCITCDAVKLKYENCTYFSAYLPPSAVYQRGVEIHHPMRRTGHISLSHGAGKATVQLHLPPSWREELRDAAFPVLVEVNGVPGVPLVTTKFGLDWGTYMSSQFDVVYIKLDVIDEGSKYVNTRIAGLQIQDYILVIRNTLEEFKFLDKTRIAVWGRGYGGYITTMILGSQNHGVKCGIAISPITDWLYYNSAFTERLLGMPSENYKEYVEADAAQRSKHIEAGSLFLIHGMADISVPYIHSLGLAKALTSQGILFRYQSYGDEGHDLSGVLEHLYLSMENFLSSCLSLDKNEQIGGQ